VSGYVPGNALAKTVLDTTAGKSNKYTLKTPTNTKKELSNTKTQKHKTQKHKTQNRVCNQYLNMVQIHGLIKGQYIF
jgi:hypothetical protein